MSHSGEIEHSAESDGPGAIEGSGEREGSGESEDCGAIEGLLSLANLHLAGMMRGRSLEERMRRVDAALAHYGLFTMSWVADRVVTGEPVEGNPDRLAVVVTVDTRVFAPDGSYVEARTEGRSVGDIDDATTEAAEQALREAITGSFGLDMGDLADQRI